MKTLLILRHAKSSWDDPKLSDHDRPLNERGRATAPKISRWILENGLIPDKIISSTAIRARQTTELIAQYGNFNKSVEFNHQLYDAPTSAYIEVLNQQTNELNCILLVGHNPTLEQLLEKLTGVRELLPTAALAQIEFSLNSWNELTLATRGRLIQIFKPKEI